MKLSAALVLVSLLLGACYESSSSSGRDTTADPGRDDAHMTDPLPPDMPITDPAVDVYPDIVPDVYPDPIYDPGPEWVDVEPICPPGLTLCFGVCVDIMVDPFNCGGCGVICPPDSSCIDGICQILDPCEGIACVEPLSCCNGECVNLWRDPENCGECGLVCPWGSSDPVLDFEGCMEPSLGIYNLCCGGNCFPVNERRCGDCRNRCPPGSNCTGLWDAATGYCEFMCMSLSGGVGAGCLDSDDCATVPSPSRTCITELMGYTFPGGYCSANCFGDDDCGPGATCVDIMVERLCFKDCMDDFECRIDEGYVCMEMPFVGGGPYCLPGYG